MADDKGAPSTRELIADAEHLRGEIKKKGKAPKTKQLVRDAEQLIGREPKPSSSKGIVIAVLFVLALLGAAALYYFML